MLTSDLAQSWQRGGRTGPRLLDTTNENLIRVAAELIDIVRGHLELTRSELDAAFDSYVGTGTDYRILRGLIKLLIDECEFETQSAIEPAEIRRTLFLEARAAHPVITKLDAKDTAAPARPLVIESVAAQLNCTPADMEAGLYADLTANQNLTAFDEPTPKDLLDRYNLAQAQALLYRAVEMRLRVAPREAAHTRPIFDAIKAYGLVHSIAGAASTGYEITLTGPISMFHRAQKYGVQMAVFLPALLLCKGWQMQAEITLKVTAAKNNRSKIDDKRPARKVTNLIYELEDGQDSLRSHLLPAAQDRRDFASRLLDNWQREGEDWTLELCAEVIDLGAIAFAPDLIARHSSGAKIYIEVFGFWTPTHLSRRVEEFNREGFTDWLIIASDELRCSREPLTRAFANVLICKTAPAVTSVRMRLDEIVTPVQPS